jgi:hypothetical protein
MRATLPVTVVAALLSFPAFAQNATQSDSDQSTTVGLGQKAAIAALNFQQGDAVGFNRARDNFSSDGWKDFIKHMEGFFDQKGAPTFTSSFVATHDAAVLDEREGVFHLRIPGTLTQSSKLGRTSYRAAIEVYVVRNQTAGEKPIKIQHLEQFTCAGSSTTCQ